jgi:hypothetical protein
MTPARKPIRARSPRPHRTRNRAQPQPDDGPQLTFDRQSPGEAPAGSETYQLGVTVPPGTQVRLTVEAARPGEWPRVIFQHALGEGQPMAVEAGRPDSGQGPSLDAADHQRPALAAGLGGQPARNRVGARIRAAWATALRSRPQRSLTPALELALLALSLGVYVAVRLYRLADYPIYFFTDEAVQTVLAADFLRDGFRDFLGHYFPTYFQNVYEFNLNLSVYAQLIPLVLFGKSVFITRLTAMLLTIPGALAVGLILRDFFRARYPWIGILVFSAAPAWFLHSRTAFETSLMVSFYACFLYSYLLYRLRSPKYLYLALVFAAAVFYTYGPGEIIIVGTGLLLVLSDARYHWAQRKTLALGLLLGIVLALPYLRFRVQLPEKHAEFLRLLDSAWVKDLPLSEKLKSSLGFYLLGLSPKYWFFANTHDLARHVMGRYGNLMTWTLPFVVAGIVIALRHFRQPEYRAVLACMLAIPLGGVVVGVGITRLLSMVVPASILCALAIDAAARWLVPRPKPAVAGILVFVLLSLVNVFLLRDALVNGPEWNRNYGMDIPYGGPQVFEAVQQLLQEEPGTRVFVSPTWANGVDILKRFFLPDDAPVDVANADQYLIEPMPLDDHMVFVLTREEYARLLGDPKITDLRVGSTIPYPDGSAGFYFVRMAYSPEAPGIFNREREERAQPVIESLTLDGQQVEVTHSRLDSGSIGHVFDGDPYTLARGMEANPFVMEVAFPSPRALAGLELTTGSMDVGLTAELYPADGGEPAVLVQEYTGLPDDPTVSLAFPPDLGPLSRVRLLITDLNSSGPAKVHVRELVFE